MSHAAHRRTHRKNRAHASDRDPVVSVPADTTASDCVLHLSASTTTTTDGAHDVGTEHDIAGSKHGGLVQRIREVARASTAAQFDMIHAVFYAVHGIFTEASTKPPSPLPTEKDGNERAGIIEVEKGVGQSQSSGENSRPTGRMSVSLSRIISIRSRYIGRASGGN